MGEDVNRDLLDHYSPIKIGHILPTSTKPKPDVFASFRPDPHKCVDYTISQTYARFRARDTTINVKDTRGTYVPITDEQLKEVLRREKEAQIVYCSGRAPQWKFVDEIWLEKQTRLQKHYRKGLATFIKRRKRMVHTMAHKEHSHILNLVGPEWYQELSPNQIRTVDNLKRCIFTDLRDDTIINTQENIAELGLVLRPNRYHILKALRHSSGDPAEFLLILYQLINPTRTTYSLNDRLLLSAVVHLTITETLREMHVRIPSPPRRVIIMNTPEIKSKKVAYESPYLEPLTVTPVPLKYTGIYTNKHIQYPESTYFSYLNYFREQCFIGDIEEQIYSATLSLKEKLLLLEYKKAQKFYDGLAGNKTMKELLKPTILNLDEDNISEDGPPIFSKVPSLAKLKPPNYEVRTCECGKLFPIYSDTVIPKSCCCGCEKKKKCTCMEYAEKFYQSICRCLKCAERRNEGNVVCVISGVRDAATCDNILPVINGVAMVKPCDCFEKFRDRVVKAQGIRNLLNSKERYTVQGLSLTGAGPVYQLSSIFYERKSCPVVSEKYKKTLAVAQEKLTDAERKHVISGVVHTINGPVYILSAVYKERGVRCDCFELYKYKKTIKKAQKQLEESPVQYVLGGLTNTKVGPVYIICGIVSKVSSKTNLDQLGHTCSSDTTSSMSEKGGNRCVCFDEYKYKMTIKKTQKKLEESSVKYILGGLTNTKVGPVYIICGIVSSDPKATSEQPRVCKTTCKTKRKGKICCLASNSTSTSTSTSENTSESTSKVTSSSELSSCPCEDSSSSSELDYPSIIICEKPSLQGDPIPPITLEKEDKSSTSNVCKGCPTVSMPGEKRGSVDKKGQNTTETNNDNTRNSIAKEIKPCSCMKKDDTSQCCQKKVEKGEEEPKKRCRCLEVEEEEKAAVSEVEEKSEEDTCRCKEELDIFLNNQCQCDLCNSDRRQKEATYILSGGMTTESGHFLSVLEGIRQKQCGCLHDHLEKIRKMEEYKRRLKTRLKMMKRNTKYAIGGVQNTPEGPCYLISGIRPPVDCDCAKALRSKEAEKERLAKMAKMPDTGRVKYEITGVKEVPGEENVYILNRALHAEECACMKMLKEYELQHKICLDEYKAFIENLKIELQLYSDEEKEEQILQNTDFDASKNEVVDENKGTVEEQTLELKETKVAEDTEKDKKCRCNNDDEEEYDEDTSEESEGSSYSSSEEDLSLCSKCRNKTSSSSESLATSKSSGSQNKCECILCKPIRDKSPVKPISIPPPKTPVDFESKRFFIYHKLPLAYKKQKNILKKVLNSMAEDGYSLPKLPDCHKLPHFRLWMQMRCGVSWKQADRWRYVAKSKDLWNHTDTCYKRIPQPNLPITKAKGRQLTWRDAKYVKSMIEEHHETFYREVKQAAINSAREFFPPTFDYEFPTKGFRDCYFSYLPAKEEEVFAYHVPESAEAMSDAKKYRSYC